MTENEVILSPKYIALQGITEIDCDVFSENLASFHPRKTKSGVFSTCPNAIFVLRDSNNV